MSSVVISGDTSGTITVAAPAVAGTYTQTLPKITGTIATLDSGTAVASTSGTSIDFTSIPANVRRITVMFSGVSTSGASQVQLQIGAGSVTTSGYASFISSVDGSSTSVASITSGFGWRSAQTAASVTYGIATLCLVSGNTWVISMSTAQTVGYASFCNGGIALGGTLDRVRLTTVNGTDTFDAGSINILYE
jgi:hypothetical protein